jgi:hypothetical protein
MKLLAFGISSFAPALREYEEQRVLSPPSEKLLTT